MENVALPQSWGRQWFEWLEQDEALEKQQAGENIIKLQGETQTLEGKLNKLLDSYLEGIIGSEVYKKKKNELFEEKLKITD